MVALAIRFGIIVALGLVAWLVVVGGRAFIARRQRQVLAAPPLTAGAMDGAIRILAFSSATCRQCHTHQWPAVQRVLSLRQGRVVAEDVDAPSHPDLAARYQILTLPATVVLDGTGRAHAVNYGFANTQRLLTQIDALISSVGDLRDEAIS